MMSSWSIVILEYTMEQFGHHMHMHVDSVLSHVAVG